MSKVIVGIRLNVSRRAKNFVNKFRVADDSTQTSAKRLVKILKNSLRHPYIEESEFNAEASVVFDGPLRDASCESIDDSECSSHSEYATALESLGEHEHEVYLNIPAPQRIELRR